jgi:hypothetical protein
LVSIHIYIHNLSCFSSQLLHNVLAKYKRKQTVLSVSKQKENNMFSKVWFRVGMILVLLAVLAGAGFWVFNLGMAQGAAVDGELPVYAGRSMMGQSGMYPGMMGMHYFFPFHFLGGLILFFVIIGLLRGIFFPRWMGRGYHHGMHGYGRWCCGNSDEDFPPMVEEWHRKMHEKETNKETKA